MSEYCVNCVETQRKLDALRKQENIVRDVSGNRLDLWVKAEKDRDRWRDIAGKAKKDFETTLSPFPCGCRTCLAHSQQKPTPPPAVIAGDLNDPQWKKHYDNEKPAEPIEQSEKQGCGCSHFDMENKTKTCACPCHKPPLPRVVEDAIELAVLNLTKNKYNYGAGVKEILMNLCALMREADK